jgi:hypothetical protein
MIPGKLNIYHLHASAIKLKAQQRRGFADTATSGFI